MTPPAASQGDRVVGTDIHIVLIPSPGGPVPTPLPHAFNGMLTGGLCPSVRIEGRPAAVLGSTADNVPPHVPQGGPFQRPPSNVGRIVAGSATVMVEGKPAARAGDTVLTCNDPADLPNGRVVATSSVMIG